MTDNFPVFSVIVPIYGVEQFLPQCIESVLQQSCADFELILVDDGSQDDCPCICDEYAKQDDRVHVIHKKNAGVVLARQTGVAIARGKYVVCLDGDDWLGRDYLQLFCNEINKNNPDIICCGSTWWSSHTAFMEKVFPIKAGCYSRDDIKAHIFSWLIEDSKGKYFPNTLWAKCFRMEVYKYQQQLVKPIFQIGEDSACVKPCVYYANSLSVLPNCEYFYRQVNSSMTKAKKPFDWNGPEIIAKHFEKQIPMNEGDFQEQLYRNCVHNIFNVAVSRFYQKKSYKSILDEIKTELNRPYYKHAVAKGSFSFGTKGYFAKKILQLRLLWVIKLFSLLKK